MQLLLLGKLCKGSLDLPKWVTSRVDRDFRIDQGKIADCQDEARTERTEREKRKRGAGGKGKGKGSSKKKKASSSSSRTKSSSREEASLSEFHLAAMFKTLTFCSPFHVRTCSSVVSPLLAIVK